MSQPTWRLAAILLFLASMAASAQPAGGFFAITNVRIFDGAKVTPSGTVVVRDGKILSVGRDLAAPKGAAVIDGSGMTLLPGLIDAHTHVFGDALRQALVFGVTTELDMFTDQALARSIRTSQKRTGTLDAADMFSAGTLVTAPGGHGTEYGFPIPTIASASEAQAFVDARIAEGSDYIKIVYDDGAAYGRPIPTLDRETLAAVIAAAKKRGKLAVVHIGSHAGARDAIAAGADALVHLFADRAPDPEFARLVKDHRAFIIPTMTVLESAGGNAGGAVFADDSATAPWLDQSARESLRRSFPLNPQHPLNLAFASETIRQLRALDVPILAGTDAPNPGTSHGVSLHRELELLVAAGMTPVEALAAATSSPARLFKLSDRGEIRPGMRADLLLVGGDPTTDIRATRNIVGVWKMGTRLDRNRWRDSLEAIRLKASRQRNAPAPPGSESGWVSRFQEDTPTALFGAGWSVSTDAMARGRSTATIVIAPDGITEGGKALRIDARIDPALPYAWAGAMFSPGPAPMAAANLSHWKEIAFRTRGDGARYRIMIFTTGHGYQPITKEFTAGAEWTEQTFRLADFDRIDGSDLMAILFVAGPAPGSYSFLIDEVRFQ
jgi:imidazolonepropionase-like amidohydrolase